MLQIQQQDWNYGDTKWSCFREDGENLVETWLKDKERSESQAKFVRSNEELRMIDSNKIDYLFGLFGETHIRFGDTRVPDEDPTIEEMTMKAIEVDILIYFKIIVFLDIKPKLQ